MTKPIHDQDAVDRHRRDDAIQATDDHATQAQPARPCPVPVKPGWAQQAYRVGCEDEWDDRMRSRYGEDY